MNNDFSIVSDYCVQNNILCEHNLKDSVNIHRFVCSGIGFTGECNHGDKYALPYSMRGINEICPECVFDRNYKVKNSTCQWDWSHPEMRRKHENNNN